MEYLIPTVCDVLSCPIITERALGSLGITRAASANLSKVGGNSDT